MSDDNYTKNDGDKANNKDKDKDKSNVVPIFKNVKPTAAKIADQFVEAVLGKYLTYNTFLGQIEFDGVPLNDAMITRFTVMAGERQCNISNQRMQDMVEMHAMQYSYNPVENYLRAMALRWDCVERLETVLIEAMGANDTPLVREYTKRWFIQSAKRMLEPGCKADSVLVLKGPQGIGKSRFAETIAVKDEWFGSGLPGLDHSMQRALEKIHRAWIFEVSELNGFKKSEVERIKEFISTRVDSYRKPYHRNSTTVKRSCSFIATTNEESYLRDSTGNRRFLHVEVTKRLDSDILRGNLAQIWGEAAHRALANEQHWLTEDMESLQLEDNKGLLYTHPVDEYLEPLIERYESIGRNYLTLKTVHDYLEDIGKLSDYTRLTTSVLNPSFVKRGWSVYKKQRVDKDQNIRCWRKK